jgi:hypothetical protein
VNEKKIARCRADMAVAPQNFNQQSLTFDHVCSNASHEANITMTGL